MNVTNRQLEWNAYRMRELALKEIQAVNSGHIGGSFSLGEILSLLYFETMKIDPHNPQDENRDRLVLSKGHCAPAMYAILAMRGFFSPELLSTFRQCGSILSGHVEMTKVPGVDMSTGSLGQGLSVAVGMALSAKTFRRDYRVFCITGDGELQEGQNWEAAMSAGNFQLDNLTLIVDNNRLQLDGAVEDIMSVYPIEDKFKAFGWQAFTADGHDIDSLRDAIAAADKIHTAPSVIVAHTVKGKGVSIFENDVKWHGGRPSTQQYQLAFQELQQKIKELETVE